MKKEKMSKEEAIEYLNRKGELASVKYSGEEPNLTEADKVIADEKKIKEVVLRGRIMGDPIATIDFKAKSFKEK